MASIEYVVNATDAASGVFAKIAASADGLDKQLEDLSKRVATPEVDLKDAKFTTGMIRAAERLDKLSAKIADPKIEVDSSKAQLEILRINAMLDRLDAKRVSVDVGVQRSLLSRLLGAGGGPGALFGLAGAGSGGGGLAAAGGGIGIGAAIAAALALAPGAIPVGLGGLIGGGGVLGGLKIGSAAEQKLLALQKSLANVTGHTPASNAARARIQAQIAAFQKANADQLQLGAAGAAFQHSVTGTFLDALTSRSPGFSAGPHGQPGGSFLSGLTPILKQLAGFVKSIGPQLGDMFRASLPFVAAFVKVMEQFAKAVLPSVTASLKIMQPDLPIIVQGFKLLAQGIAGFITNLGPGMKDSAIIFKAAMMVIKGLLQITGAAASVFAISIVKTAEFVRAAARSIPPFFDRMRHDIAVIFDSIRGGIANAWNTIWSNTKNAVTGGIGAVVSFFKALPGKVLGAMFGLGHQLYAFGHAALGDFLSGLQAIGKSILGWLGSFWNSIVGLAKKILGVFSPSAVFYDIGKNLMVGLEHGIKAHAQSAVNAAKSAAQSAAGAAAHGGPAGGSAAAAQAYARRIAGAYGWANQWGAINAVAMRESGWSMTARNPSSGAYGIAQFINGPSEYYQYGGNPNTIAGQVLAFYNYIRQRYGNPSNAWQHELNFGWYDRGGWLPPGLSLAMNTTGAPERVGGGNTYNITVHVPPTANKAEVGRATVEAIREFEKRSGAGWRS